MRTGSFAAAGALLPPGMIKVSIGSTIVCAATVLNERPGQSLSIDAPVTDATTTS
jgi:hypothetical protein